MTPAVASIASLSSVLPDDACPTIAKFRMSAAWYSFINCLRAVRPDSLLLKVNGQKLCDTLQQFFWWVIDVGNDASGSFQLFGARACQLFQFPLKFRHALTSA